MDWRIEGRQIRFDGGGHVDFEHDVKEVVAVLDVLVVVLDVPPGAVMTENVFGVSRSGIRLWQIERIASTSSDLVNCYVGADAVGANWVGVVNWNGVRVTVDVLTGNVLSQQFVK